MQHLLSYQQTKMSHLSMILASPNEEAPGAEPFAIQRIQECHSPSQRQGQVNSPRQAIMYAYKLAR